MQTIAFLLVMQVSHFEKLQVQHSAHSRSSSHRLKRLFTPLLKEQPEANASRVTSDISIIIVALRRLCLALRAPRSPVTAANTICQARGCFLVVSALSQNALKTKNSQLQSRTGSLSTISRFLSRAGLRAGRASAQS